jgi:GAF domain-containing protein/HAMP domain-containing protein
MTWFNSIRTRLIITIIAFTVLPAAFIGVIATTLSGQATRSRVGETLEAVGTLKGTQLQNWTHELQLDLAAEVERDTDSRRMLRLLTSEPTTIVFQTLYDIEHSIFDNSIASRQIFDELFLLDLHGNVVLSTVRLEEGKNYAHRDFYINGLKESYLQPFQYEMSLGQLSMIVSRPLKDDQDHVVGVLAGRVNTNRLNEIMLERTGIGQTGETYLVGLNGMLLTEARSPEYKVAETYVNSQGAILAMQASQPGSGEYTNYQAVPVIGAYRWIPELNAALLAEQTQEEAYTTLRATINLIILASTVALIAAIAAAVFTSRSLTRPLIELTGTSEKIAQGNLDLRADTGRSDEIGSLAQAFNSMTSQLRNLIGGLEKRVAERTTQLETRSEQLLTAAEVSRSVATILDTDLLIQRVVNLIQQRFGLYYVGLFLVDAQREWAVLRADTGSAGQAMLQRGHRLRIDESSMIGWSVSNAQSRIALEAEADPVRLATPDLPETRSEAAIPLRSRGQVLGAITIQSAAPGAFDAETVAVFQTMADQVAVALDNARLFDETQAALQAAQQAYGELSREAWVERLQAKPVAYRRTTRGVTPAEPAPVRTPSQDKASNGSLIVPIKTRGYTIGYVNAQKRPAAAGEQAPSDSPDWNAEEIDLLETLIDQLGVALDSARLFEETQQLAERERIVDEVTSRMRATMDIDNVLQTAVREIRNTLDLAEVEVRIGNVQESSSESEDPQSQPTGGYEEDQ